MTPSPHEVTQLLLACANGDEVALQQLVPLVHDELRRLAQWHMQVVEMRFFGGLTVEETAEALHISPETVMRDWKIAKLWLRRQLDSEAHDEA